MRFSAVNVKYRHTVDDDVGLLVSMEEAAVLLVEGGDVERHARVQRGPLLRGAARRLRRARALLARFGRRAGTAVAGNCGGNK